MAIMMKSAHRAEGAEQPSIKLGMFRIRIPFVYAPWELPEMIQAMVVFVTGVSAVAYLQDIFGLPFSVALSIVCIHELLYVFQNIVGDPIVAAGEQDMNAIVQRGNGAVYRTIQYGKLPFHPGIPVHSST